MPAQDVIDAVNSNQEESKYMASGDYRKIHNVPRTILLKMIKILDDPLVFGLSLYDQATLVKSFCFFMRDQIKDIRLLGGRSTIMKDFYKHEDFETGYKRNKENLAVDGY